nr:prepilin-type N-terminal cleavage/methylation domain-containing protein [uncultured Methylotenera sp.]
MKRTQAGFTLIELAIVLVIIGLLLGGVLKGQELINSAKAKSIAGDFKNAQIFIYGYQDKFKALPGDDASVVAHVGSTATLATTGGTVGNARIEGAWNSSTLTDESALFWQHVRLAGFATGPTNTGDANYLPRNSDNGRIGVQSMSSFNTITGMTGLYVVCSENIAGRLVKQIDINMDDGNTATGSLMAIVSGTATPVATTAIAEGSPYTVCMSF